MTRYFNCTFEEYQKHVDEARKDEKLLANVKRAASDLETKGYAVIEHVVEPEMCDWALQQFWSATTTASKGRLKQPHSAEDLKDFKFKDFYYHMGGIIAHGELTHLPFMHSIRTHPKVALVFGALYGVDTGLIVSSDRMNYQQPEEFLPRARTSVPKDRANISRVEEARRIHVDQSLTHKIGLHCIQGLVTFLDCDQDGDASLECVEGSHLWHTGMRKRLGLPETYPGNSLDWHLFTDEQKKMLDESGAFKTLISVKAKKGSLILWDSRLMHQAGRIRRPRPNPTPRFVEYVCMAPTFRTLTPRQVKTKRKIFSDLKCASHWPISENGGKIFPPPRTYGQKPPEFDFSELVVRPLDTPGKYPVLERFYGLEPWKPNELSLFRNPKPKPLLQFAPSSGVRVPWAEPVREPISSSWSSEPSAKRFKCKR